MYAHKRNKSSATDAEKAIRRKKAQIAHRHASSAREITSPEPEDASFATKNKGNLLPHLHHPRRMMDTSQEASPLQPHAALEREVEAGQAPSRPCPEASPKTGQNR
ncbi:hypothetical protein HPB49_006000 [Dermacentor silvarum]|uniref:Uncharacterized protein n=1 Tax=Dermacentor silvarum TaxID=543639 RepID=A0ACB8DB71_DERSI|nr:hypothetical protein HPB49_006000 [Dermacentor silvarum]